MPKRETVHDELICLSRRDFSETSLILVLISRNHGKISLLAKGIKRPQKKTAGGIDILDKIGANFSINLDGLGLLHEFSHKNSWRELRTDIKKWYAGLFITEIVNLSTKELLPIPEIYDLLNKTLDSIANAESQQDLGRIIVNTTLMLLHYVGYKPELRSCVICHHPFTPNDWLFFSASSGGMVCRDCEAPIMEKIRIEHRGWYYLLGKVQDIISGKMGFDILMYMIREHIEKEPALAEYCRKNIFT